MKLTGLYTKIGKISIHPATLSFSLTLVEKK
jgi:hypothetical protein